MSEKIIEQLQVRLIEMALIQDVLVEALEAVKANAGKPETVWHIARFEEVPATNQKGGSK